MPAQNTPRPHSSSEPSPQPDTQQGVQSGAAYQAKPARRTHRRLLTPPLAQKNGIDPIQLILPLPEELPADLTPNNTAPATIADYLIARFYPNDPQIIHARFDTGEVRLDDGTILTSDSPYMPGERIWYFRELADEPQLPSDTLALAQGIEVFAETSAVGMLSHFIEGEAIDVDVAIDSFEKSARCADFFDNEMTDATHYRCIVSRKHAFVGRIAQGDWDEIETRHELDLN